MTGGENWDFPKFLSQKHKQTNFTQSAETSLENEVLTFWNVMWIYTEGEITNEPNLFQRMLSKWIIASQERRFIICRFVSKKGVFE